MSENPFYVQPMGDYSQHLSGLGQMIGDIGREKKTQARFQEVQGAMQQAWESQDPDKMAEVSIMYPEARESMELMFGFYEDKQGRNPTKPIVIDTYRRVLADPQNATEYLTEGINKVSEIGGEPMNMLTDLGMFRRDPDSAVKNIEMGFSALDPEGYKAYQKQSGVGSETPMQFGAQQTLKDSKGNLFFATTRRNPQTGAVESVTASIDGSDKKPVGNLSIAGGYGLTAEEKINQIAAEGGAETRAKTLEGVRQDYIKQGTAAKPLLKQTQRMLDLNERIRTGKTAGLQKAMGDLFGVTDPDIGEFNSLAGNLVLGSIRQLGANPTEGERAYLSEIMPSIQQSGKVNEAILKNLAEIQERQIERAKWLVNNPGKSVEEYLLLDEDFTPDRSVQDSGQTSTGGAPSAAIDYLRQNPQFKEQFRAKYGYIPEGI